jgi:hypothetical protein
MVISIGETHIYALFGMVLNGSSPLLQCTVGLKVVKPKIVVSPAPSSFRERKIKATPYYEAEESEPVKALRAEA